MKRRIIIPATSSAAFRSDYAAQNIFGTDNPSTAETLDVLLDIGGGQLSTTSTRISDAKTTALASAASYIVTIDPPIAPPPPTGPDWTPSKFGERIWREWDGNFSSVILPFDNDGHKALRTAWVVFNGDFTLEFNANTPPGGSGGGAPAPHISNSSGTVTVQWARKNDDLNELSTSVGAGAHGLLTYRAAGGDIYLWVDGVLAASTTGAGIVCPIFRNPKEPTGLINGTGLHAQFISGEAPTTAEREKLFGWMRVNHGITLPGGHTYESTTPVVEVGDWDDTLEIQVTEQEFALQTMTLSNEGDAIQAAVAGWSIVHQAGFASASIGEEWSPPTFDWYARVHGAGTRQAQPQFLSATSNDGNPYYHYGTHKGENSMRLRMEPLTGTTNWKGPVCCSMNQAGDGHYWKPPFYMQIRLAYATNSGPMNVGRFTFPAVWTKDRWEYIYPFMYNKEWDIMEGSSNLPTVMSHSFHDHEPAQLNNVNGQANPRRTFNHLYKITGNSPVGTTSYDGEYIHYGAYMDADVFIQYWGPSNGVMVETSRSLNHPAHAQREYYAILDIALRGGAANLTEANTVGGPIDMQVADFFVKQP